MKLKSVMNSRRCMCPLRTRLVQCLKPSTLRMKWHPTGPQTLILLAAKDVSVGSKAALTAPKRDFRSTPNNGYHQTSPVGPVSADIVAKVFLGCRTKILRTADAFY